MPHLFEKFYRVADHKKIAKGTGLGLNLVKHIVETVHHGRVSVTSQVGKGSTFSMCLPMSEAAAAAAPPPPSKTGTYA
jgi:two-component system phosphate regulon sensor histidine kinase PhoR